jgi:hypothetical protein
MLLNEFPDWKLEGRYDKVALGTASVWINQERHSSDYTANVGQVFPANAGDINVNLVQED